MAATRQARAIWEGDLVNGKGAVDAVSSGAFTALPISWAARTEAPQGQTSPEELLAAAHASCFSMQLSHLLAGKGTPPARLQVSAAVTFVPGTGVTTSALEVRGTVPGLDAAGFAKVADEAKDTCPISGALKGNVQLSVKATLA